MNHLVSPYDRANGRLEKVLNLAVLGSIAVHVFVCWVFLFLLPALQADRQRREEAIITVEFVAKGSEVSTGLPAISREPGLVTPPPPVLQVDLSKPIIAPDDYIIPLGDKAPEKSLEMEKISTPPPSVESPPVEQENPPAKNLDVDIAKAIEGVQSRVRNTTDGASGDGGESGTPNEGQRIDPEKMRYYSQVKDIVSLNWIPPAEAISGSIKTVIQVRIEPGGLISASKILQSSGNAEYDESVERAVRKSSPLPGLPPVFEGMADEPALVFDFEKLRESAAH